MRKDWFKTSVVLATVILWMIAGVVGLLWAATENTWGSGLSYVAVMAALWLIFRAAFDWATR